MNALPGKLLGVTLDGVYYKCQTNADLTFTAAVTADDTCKPDQGVGADPIQWVTNTVDSKSWVITFSAKAFADGLGASGNQLSRFFIESDLAVTAHFMTNPDLGDGIISDDVLYEGSGLLTSLKLNGPEKGASTYDATITGNGPMTITETNRTT
jgi:hypothetical protein